MGVKLSNYLRPPAKFNLPLFRSSASHKVDLLYFFSGKSKKHIYLSKKKTFSHRFEHNMYAYTESDYYYIRNHGHQNGSGL